MLDQVPGSLQRSVRSVPVRSVYSTFLAAPGALCLPWSVTHWHNLFHINTLVSAQCRTQLWAHNAAHNCERTMLRTIHNTAYNSQCRAQFTIPHTIHNTAHNSHCRAKIELFGHFRWFSTTFSLSFVTPRAANIYLQYLPSFISCTTVHRRGESF